MILDWLRRRRLAERLAQIDAAALLRDAGDQAYWEARRREHEVVWPGGASDPRRSPAHWRRVALIVAKETGHEVGLDVATRMLDRSGRRRSEKIAAMRYRIQFLDRSANVTLELTLNARTLAGAIVVAKEDDWPPRAVTLRILDANGLEVYAETKGGPV